MVMIGFQGSDFISGTIFSSYFLVLSGAAPSRYVAFPAGLIYLPLLQLEQNVQA